MKGKSAQAKRESRDKRATGKNSKRVKRSMLAELTEEEKRQLPQIRSF